MNTFTQYIPAIADGDPFEIQFTDKEEILNHEWIQKWKEFPGFQRFEFQNWNDGTALVVVAEGRDYLLGEIDGYV